MRLQIDDAGAWRNIIDFDTHNLKGIQADARALALCARGKVPRLRIIEPMYCCDGQDYRWREWRAS